MKVAPLLIAVLVLAWSAPLRAEVMPKPFTIPSESMLPTLEPGDWIWTEKVDYADLERGDVIVYLKPDERRYVGRAIAFGGETISLTEGVVMIDGNAAILRDIPDLDFDFKNNCPGAVRSAGGKNVCTLSLFREILPFRNASRDSASHQIAGFSNARSNSNLATMKPVKIPPNFVFVIGDNRGNSSDSRRPSLGPIAGSAVLFRATHKNLGIPIK